MWRGGRDHLEGTEGSRRGVGGCCHRGACGEVRERELGCLGEGVELGGGWISCF